MTATARWHTERTPELPNRTEAISAIAEAVGFPLLPWVRKALDVSTEYDPDTGEPHRRSVLWTVPRQSGKSLALACITIEALLREPELVGVYVAQSRGSGARRLQGIGSLLVRSGLDPGAKVTMGVGNERIKFSNGSVMYVESPNADSIHGDSLDKAVLDEVFAISPIVLTAVTPAMAARPKAQLWMISTAGTLADSVLLNERREAGRDNPNGAMAFVEYSLEDGASPYDMEAMRRCHPGLGHTTTEKHLLAEQSILSPGQYLRAYGNISTSQEHEAIPMELWEESAQALAIPDGIVLAVEVTDWGTSVAAAFETETGFHADVVDHQEGSEAAWAAERVEELARRFHASAIVVDTSGPAGALRPQLQRITEERAIPLLARTSRSRAQGDVWLMEQLRKRRLTHNDLAPLEEAVRKVGTEPSSDLWRFSRKRAIVDVSPIIALSLAAFGAYEVSELVPVAGIAWG
jgi:hypothetical protein